MISANGGLPAQRYTPQVTPRWPRGSEPASVDRHSGYLVAVPARKKGLLAKEVAVMMIRHCLTVFDIPRTICSDRRPQFTGGWFKAMCSLMGIRQAQSVAYLSRSNGRAEVAGRQLFEKLRKIHITNPRRNWFEEMWPALKAHHDTPTPGGLSPTVPGL